MGPTVDGNDRYIPWTTEVKTYRCPSDPGRGAPAYGRTNYAVCLGDSYAQPNGSWVWWDNTQRVGQVWAGKKQIADSAKKAGEINPPPK
ncbi:hypothetical protein [Allorhodopirellula heiligendammensis]|uniref:Uncharacterized protein n=1 Tax=Allorhodopirellula heiligendammensis TaxID=2714739 RepID=A0A5C6BU27_9BACT|nr:hypothetical protein [Allorhodopirellula heiligendammensis]TWU15187.1 hypothetical protein Poly21_23800 [Allorhodopirellula heiligendammensis]